MPDNAEKIEAIEALQDAGVSSVSTDGQSTSFDQAALQRRKLELQRSDPNTRGRKPRISSIDLSQIW